MVKHKQLLSGSPAALIQNLEHTKVDTETLAWSETFHYNAQQDRPAKFRASVGAEHCCLVPGGGVQMFKAHPALLRYVT